MADRWPAMRGSVFSSPSRSSLSSFLGQWLDRKLGTSPVFLMLGVFVGAGAAFYGMYRKLMADQEAAEEARKKERRGSYSEQSDLDFHPGWATGAAGGSGRHPIVWAGAPNNRMGGWDTTSARGTAGLRMGCRPRFGPSVNAGAPDAGRECCSSPRWLNRFC